MLPLKVSTGVQVTRVKSLFLDSSSSFRFRASRHRILFGTLADPWAQICLFKSASIESSFQLARTPRLLSYKLSIFLDSLLCTFHYFKFFTIFKQRYFVHFAPSFPGFNEEAPLQLLNSVNSCRIVGNMYNYLSFFGMLPSFWRFIAFLAVSRVLAFCDGILSFRVHC